MSRDVWSRTVNGIDNLTGYYYSQVSPVQSIIISKPSAVTALVVPKAFIAQPCFIFIFLSMETRVTKITYTVT